VLQECLGILLWLKNNWQLPFILFALRIFPDKKMDSVVNRNLSLMTMSEFVCRECDTRCVCVRNVTVCMCRECDTVCMCRECDTRCVCVRNVTQCVCVGNVTQCVCVGNVTHGVYVWGM
jgi:hypothetical protein